MGLKSYAKIQLFRNNWDTENAARRDHSKLPFRQVNVPMQDMLCWAKCSLQGTNVFVQDLMRGAKVKKVSPRSY